MAITSVRGIRYEIGEPLGKSGVAKVFLATRMPDGSKFALRYYASKPDASDPMGNNGRIRRIIKDLMEKTITDNRGNPNPSFVPPLDRFDLLNNGGFGYIMPLVDTRRFFSLKRLWHPDLYPDAKAICEAGKRLAAFFEQLHARGYCYRYINEESICIDPTTGEIRIIDCDGIHRSGERAEVRFSPYAAPEIYETETPNEDSDKYALATYFYRLLVGGYPMDGSRSERYLLNNELDIYSAAKTIYGSDALFVFDPNDRSNTIRDITRGYPEDQIRKWKILAEYWDNLPTVLRYWFVRTFSDGLKWENRRLRTLPGHWYESFDHLQRNELVKCECQKYNFTSRETCLFCGKTLPSAKGVNGVTDIGEKNNERVDSDMLIDPVPATKEKTLPDEAESVKAEQTSPPAIDAEENRLVDEAIANARRIVAKAEADADQIRANAQASANDLLLRAEEEAAALLAKARADARACAAQVEARASATMADAASEAKAIRSRAVAEASELLQSAQTQAKRMSDTRKNAGLRMYNQNHAELMGKFTSMSTVMMELNEIMGKTQEMLIRTHTKTVFDQLYDLYSLIADNRDSLSQRADYDKNIDLQICCGNLEEFMYMITEYLAEYGIETISTQAGAPFEGKYHNAVGNRNFNPGMARVTKSLRCGFVWDEVVLVKEKVAVC